MKCLRVAVMIFLVSLSQQAGAASFRTLWLAGTVHDASGSPHANGRVEIMNFRLTELCDIRYNDIETAAGSITTTDSAGRYKIGVRGYGWEDRSSGCNISFALFVNDATRQLALSPQITVDMENVWKKEDNSTEHLIFPAAALASAGIDEATLNLDLLCKRLVNAKVHIRREDGKNIDDAGCSATLDTIGPGTGYHWGEIYSRGFLPGMPVSGPTAELIIPAILPGRVHTLILDASGGCCNAYDSAVLNPDDPAEVVLPVDYFRKMYMLVIDQNNNPVPGATVGFVYMRDNCYSFCSEREDCQSDEKGRIVVDWGTRDFLEELLLVSVPAGYEMVERDESGALPPAPVENDQLMTVSTFENPVIVRIIKKEGESQK